jgi:hypothetical protein
MAMTSPRYLCHCLCKYRLDQPAFLAQQGSYPPIPVATILTGQCHDPLSEHFFVIRFPHSEALG